MSYQGHYSSEQRRDGLVQSDPKKRKRNFSNRTKTGCLTCRKRKKKCDEAKPECKWITSSLYSPICFEVYFVSSSGGVFIYLTRPPPAR